MVIYDFACALQAYCLNRDHDFFAETAFLVDRFHDDNHSCGQSFHLEENHFYKDLNTQANEQYNSVLRALHAPLSYTIPENFMLHMRLYLYMINTRRIEEINEELANERGRRD